MDKILLIKILYAAASLQGVFLSIILWRTKVNQPANRILTALLLIISFHLVLVGFDEREFFMTFPHLSRISWVIGTLYGPLVFVFIQLLTRSLLKPRWLNAFAFLPFLIVFVNQLPYFIQLAETKRSYLDSFSEAMKDDFGWNNQFVSLVQVLFVVGNLWYYLRWERKRSQEFSSMEEVRILWLRDFLLFLLAITFFGVVVFFARTWQISFLADFYRFHFIGVVFLFYWLSYKALTQPVLFGIVETPAAPEKYRKSAVEETQLEEAFRRIRQALESERLFAQTDLTLTELSEKSGVPRHQVSQAINTLYKGNFFDLVNDYRVAEFKRLAVDPTKKHLSLLGIAQEAGFNSKASFYAVFKKKTGLTPSQYLENPPASTPASPNGLE